MKNQIICFGVRKHEESTFNLLADKYDCNLVLKEEFLTNDNIQLAFGFGAIMVRANCFLNATSLKTLQENGLKYLLTRTIGYNHIDIKFAKEIGLEVANVPNYSPTSVAELAVTMAMMLSRNIVSTILKTQERDFLITSDMFVKEMRTLTVGIIGMGKIGKAAAKIFNGIAGRVFYYDSKNDERNKKLGTSMSLDELLCESDIVTLHIPYTKGENDDLVNEKFIHKMKDEAILINTSRGELVDINALCDAIENGKLQGAGLDVLKNEKEIFFKKHEKDVNDLQVERLLKLKEKIIITPHIGSSTYQALYDMISISLQNYDSYILNGECKNSLTSNF